MAVASDTGFPSAPYTAAAYFVGIVVAEALVASGATVVGLVCHAVVLFASVNAYVLASLRGGGRGASVHVLGLVPLLRILSLALPVSTVREVYWYALVGTPLLVAIALAARAADAKTLALGSSRAQAAVAVTGLPLSLVAFSILRPDPLVESFTWSAFLAAGAMLLVFTGFVEEVLFRGLVQGAFLELFGQPRAIALTSAFFAAVYLGSRSALYVAFMGFVGLVFGWAAATTRALVGVSVAHGLLTVGAILVWPLIL